MRLPAVDFAPRAFKIHLNTATPNAEKKHWPDDQSVHSTAWSDFEDEASVDKNEPDTVSARWKTRSKYVDLCSAVVSFGCFVTSLVMAWSGNENPHVGLNREMLLYSQQTNVTAGIRILQSTYNAYCSKYPMRQYQPTWFSEKNFTGVAISTNVHAGDVALWPLVIWVYIWSTIFQYWRYYMATLPNDRTFYHPEKPELSRWIEYLFTSPFQIMIVSLSFGFSSLDTLISSAALQAALVLFGYDIEQQIKKIYKGKRDGQNFQHVLRPVVRNLRLPLYLIVTWGIHFVIWGLPFAASSGHRR